MGTEGGGDVLLVLVMVVWVCDRLKLTPVKIFRSLLSICHQDSTALHLLSELDLLLVNTEPAKPVPTAAETRSAQVEVDGWELGWSGRGFRSIGCARAIYMLQSTPYNNITEAEGGLRR